MIDLTIERALQLVSKIWAEESEQQQNKANNVFINKTRAIVNNTQVFHQETQSLKTHLCK